MQVIRVAGFLLKSCTWQNIVIPCRGFKHGFKSKIPKRRKATSLGVYAGQISNFDTNDLNWFPIDVPNIPLTPEGTNYKPSKLLAIWRINKLRGQPYWVREIMEKHLKLDDETIGPAIVKNTAMMNQRLWHVKHLVTIKPITFPNGIPTEEDIGYTCLKNTGELVISKKLKVDLQQLEEPEQDVKEMDGETLRKHLRLRWLSGYYC